jgi:hypothetical protein
MATSTFSDWLQARGHDEAKMDRDRHAQLMRFWQDEKALPPPPTAKDSLGADVVVGDMVTMTFRVSMIHAGDDGVNTLNLDLLASDSARHYMSCPANIVKKV